jgi:hypothetical protein
MTQVDKDGSINKIDIIELVGQRFFCHGFGNFQRLDQILVLEKPGSKPRIFPRRVFNGYTVLRKNFY